MKKNTKTNKKTEVEHVKEEAITMQGTVTEALPGTLFKVTTADGMNVLCTLSGRLRKNRIHILPSDTVQIEVSVYDASRGRISYRM